MVLIRDLPPLRPEPHPDPAVGAGAKAPEGRLVIRYAGAVPAPARIEPVHLVQDELSTVVAFFVGHRHRNVLPLDAEHAVVPLEVDAVCRGQARQEVTGGVDGPVPSRAERDFLGG